MKHTPRPQRRRADRGFTMVEVLAVVIVLGILSAIAVPKYLEHRTKSRVAAAVSDARNLGAMIEDAWAKDRVYPETLAENAGNILGARLSEHNKVARYARDSDGMGFELCLVYQEGATIKAYALYDSNDGGLIGKGSGTAPGSACTANTTAPVTPITSEPTGGGTGGSTGGSSGGETGGGGSSSLAAPSNLNANTIDGTDSAALGWQGVDGADRYEVFLDGATTPEWAGTATSTELLALPKGYHEVTVKAIKGSDESDLSEPATFTIYGDNDFLADAHPVRAADCGVTWRSSDYNNAGKTAETGEPTDSLLGMWWTMTPQKNATVQIKVIAASDGTGPYNYPSIYVWDSTATDVAALGTFVAKQTGSGGTVGTVSMSMTAGKTYKIRLSSMSTSWNSKFRLQVTPGPCNDNYGDAANISPVALDATAWYSPDTDTTYAGAESGEPVNSTRSMWWTMSVPRTAGYEVRVVATSDNVAPYAYHTLTVWDSTTTDVSSLGTPLAQQSGSGGSPNVVWFSAAQGRTIKFRLSTPSSGGAGRFRLRVTPGPANDGLADPQVVTLSGAGQTWTSPDVDNTYAHFEPGEPASADGSMWWTYTATHSGTVNVEVINPTDGSTFFTYPFLRAWRTTTTDVTQLGTLYAGNTSGGGLSARFSMAVSAGETYKIRVSTSNSRSTSYRTDYRLRVTS